MCMVMKHYSCFWWVMSLPLFLDAGLISKTCPEIGAHMLASFSCGVFFLKYGADPNKKSKLSCHLISHRGWLGYGGFLCLCHAICFAVFCGFGILAKGCLREDK
ncbi:unnamed protein product [Cuscuta europaea]|uniref:Uncharacterized protein n=1 Tax=Cuscuta europaea TaxID=41803 RepID=A0A9P1EHM7_CUSEU|nr:unnamed protein product [Cuscuta europaea]